jgi:uncharacterized protein (TIGR00288 family)
MDIFRMFGIKHHVKGIAFFVNGPDVLSHKKNIDMQKTIQTIKVRYNVRVAKVYLDQFASDKLIEAVNNQGYEAEMCISDVNVAMAIGIMEEIYNPNIEGIAIMTSNPLFKVLLKKIKKYNKRTILIGGRNVPKELIFEADDFIQVK